MRASVLALAVLAVVAPHVASAQSLGRKARSADGTVYNPTESPEWREAGGNYAVYQQIMQRKMMALHQKQIAAQQKAAEKEYQAFLKQQQAFEKWIASQKALKEQGKPVDPLFQQMLDQQERSEAQRKARAARAAAKKSRRTPPFVKADPKAAGAGVKPKEASVPPRRAPG